VKRRHRPEDVALKPYRRNGYGHAFDTGSMSGAWWGVFEPARGEPAQEGDEFTMAELAKAWAAYRDEYLAYRAAHYPHAGKSWAELVFDENINADAGARPRYAD
jgi:hypothetical protein